jgi:hypothetical protein
MKWVFSVLGVIVVFVLLLFIAGACLPKKHGYTRSLHLKQTPESVFNVLADVGGMPKWSQNVTAIEKLPPSDGKEVTRQTIKGSSIPLKVVTSQSVPPSLLVRTLEDEKSFFAGSWTYKITANKDGCDVALQEDAEIRPALFRMLAKVFGPTKYLDEHLQDLAMKFGESAQIY